MFPIEYRLARRLQFSYVMFKLPDMQFPCRFARFVPCIPRQNCQDFDAVRQVLDFAAKIARLGGRVKNLYDLDVVQARFVPDANSLISLRFSVGTVPAKRFCAMQHKRIHRQVHPFWGSNEFCRNGYAQSGWARIASENTAYANAIDQKRAERKARHQPLFSVRVTGGIGDGREERVKMVLDSLKQHHISPGQAEGLINRVMAKSDEERARDRKVDMIHEAKVKGHITRKQADELVKRVWNCS